MTAIERLLTDHAAAKALGAAGQERAKAEFSWEKMVEKYSQIYDSLLATAKPRFD